MNVHSKSVKKGLVLILCLMLALSVFMVSFASTDGGKTTIFDGWAATGISISPTIHPQGNSISGYIKPDLDSTDSTIKAGFSVAVSGTALTGTTDNNGYFLIRNVPAGTYSLNFTKAGYLSRTVTNVPSGSQVGTTNQPVDMWAGELVVDNVLNMADIMEAAKAFNTTSADAKYSAVADFNKDDAVNMADIMIIVKHFNQTSANYGTPVIVPPTPVSYTATPTYSTASNTPTPTQGNGQYPTWDKAKVYVGGDKVSHNGNNWQAKWWTQGEEPGVAGVWEPIAGPSTQPSNTPTPSNGSTPTYGTPPASAPRMYVGYSSTWNTSIYDLKPENIPNYFTHINLAFAKPNTAYQKGSYAFDQAVAGFEFVEGATTMTGQKKFTAQQAQDLRNNIAALKARGTQVWVSIGGWSYSQGSSWTGFNAPRVVDLALDLGASGIDVDWETEGASCNKGTADTFACSTDGQIKGIITSLYNEIKSRGANIGISVAGWSTGAYYVKGSPFEEGKVQWGSPFGGVMYRVVKDNGHMINFINLMSYDGGEYYDPREGYESYRAIYSGPINMGMEIAPEGAGGAVLKLNAEPGSQYDGEMLTGQNNMATKYYNVETMVNYIKNKGKPFDGFMIWQIWKQRVHQPAPAGAATENSAGQYVCRNLPLRGDANQIIPNLPKLTP